VFVSKEGTRDQKLRTIEKNGQEKRNIFEESLAAYNMQALPLKEKRKILKQMCGGKK